MAFRTILGFLAPFLFSLSIHADVLKINPDHPDLYTVVKGDTLWDISGKFLQNPWQWPQIWNNNPQIKDPDLIYPGDTVYFSIVDGKPRLSLSKNKILSPRIRKRPLEEAITLIPIDAIAQFLNSPRVVTKNELAKAPYVVDFAGEHIVVGAGDRIYVRSILNPETPNFTIYREGEVFINPITEEILAYEAKFIGESTIEKAGDPATLLVTNSNSAIRKGDRVMPSSKGEIALNYFPRPPETPIFANIISVLDGVTEIGQYNIVVIDKGTKDGLKTGHTLVIYHLGRTVSDPFSGNTNESVKLPNEEAGILMVFRPFERVSYALVLKATRSIHILDKAQTE